MNRPEIIAALRNHLLPLGNTKEEIADSFRALGLKGKAESGKDNVISLNLTQSSDIQLRNLWCGWCCIEIRTGDYRYAYLYYLSSLSLVAFRDFATDLFSGRYPDLIA